MTNNNNWQPKAIIFDMDGLLVDSEPIWHEAETAMIEARGHVYTPEVRAQIIGLRLDEFVEILHTVYNFNESHDAIIQEVTDRMLALIPLRVTVKPGAQEVIDYVVGQGFPVAIASSSPLSIIEATVQSQNWQDIIPIRCSADAVARGKPAPDVYLKAAELLGVDPADCLALEDSPPGARAAVSAGMVCYAVPDTTHSGLEAFDGVTPHVFHSLHDVLAVLKK